MRISMRRPAGAAITAGTLALLISSTMAQTSDRDRDLAAADHLRQLGQTTEALAAYRTLVERNGSDPTVVKAAAVAAGQMRDWRTSASWFERLKALNPADISARESLLIAYGLLADPAAFEAERADLVRFWHETTDPAMKSRHLFIRERFRVRDHDVGAFECFEWQGRFALKYIFLVRGAAAKTEYWITMGSYYERQKFHVDIYKESQRALIWMSDEEPSYAAVREKVLLAIEDDSITTGKRVISSSFQKGRRFSPSNTCQLYAR